MGRPDNTLETMYAIGEKKIKVFKNGPSKICGRQPLKHLK